MTPTQARNAIMTRYLDEFSGLFDIALDNQPFTPPETGEGVKWARVNVQFNTGRQETLGSQGNRKFNRRGLLFVQVFTPAGHATNGNDDLALNSLDLFDGVRLGDLWFTDGRIVTIGSDGEWYQQNVVLDFTFEAIK
jgi:hypothetical protein